MSGDRPRALALLPVVVLAAAVLRLPGLGSRSLWVDEIVTAQVAPLPDLGSVLAATPSDHMPLFFVLTWLLHTAGLAPDEVGVRLLPALYGILLVPAVFLLGRRLICGRAGLIAAVLMAVAPFAVWYSQEAVAYTQLMLAATLLMWAADRAPERARLGDWLLLAATASFTLYSHFTGALVTLAAFLYVAGRLVAQGRDPALRGEPLITRFLGLATAGMLALLTVAPWVPALRAYLSVQATLQIGGIAGTPDVGAHLRNLADGLSLLPIPILLAGVGAAALVAIPAWRRAGALLATWLLIPIAALAIALGPGILNLHPRYFSALFPAVALLAGAGAEALIPLVTVRLRLPAPAVASALTVALVLQAVPQLLAWSAENKDDWRAAAAAVRAGSPEGGVALAMGYGSAWAARDLRYYLARQGSELAVYDAGASFDDRLAVEVGRAAGPAWAVFNTADGPPDLRTEARSANGDFTPVPPPAPGFQATRLVGVTVVRAPDLPALLAWAGPALPIVRANGALAEAAPLAPSLLPASEGDAVTHLDAAGAPAQRTWTFPARPGDALVASFNCTPGGGADARVYVSAHDPGGRWLALYPGNAGYRCGGGAGAFALAVPDGASRVQLWLRVTGRGYGEFSAVELRPVPL